MRALSSVVMAAPGLLDLPGELRAPLEAAAFLLGPDVTRSLPRGDGHPVLLLPPFGLDGRAMLPLARALDRRGYAAHDWGEGRSLGLRQRTANRLVERVIDLHRRHGRTVSLVGWSAGGLYAREVARARPDLVRRVITLGAPVHPHASGHELVDLARVSADAILAARGSAPLVVHPEPPPVPLTAIQAGDDDVVAAAAARERNRRDVDNIVVDGTHLGLGASRAAFRAMAPALGSAATGPDLHPASDASKPTSVDR
jgi:pimeloyl-ACP methyl ester carboxylesterase